jgi:hypothetical protein
MNDKPSQDALGQMPGPKHRLRPAPWQIEDAEEPMSVSCNARYSSPRFPAFDKVGNRACQVCGVAKRTAAIAATLFVAPTSLALFCTWLSGTVPDRT